MERNTESFKELFGDKVFTDLQEQMEKEDTISTTLHKVGSVIQINRPTKIIMKNGEEKHLLAGSTWIVKEDGNWAKI